jgi:hypothetical protein
MCSISAAEDSMAQNFSNRRRLVGRRPMPQADRRIVDSSLATPRVQPSAAIVFGDVFPAWTRQPWTRGAATR